MDLSNRVAAELAVRNLVANLAHVADHGSLEHYRDLFCEDALWDFPGGARHGIDDIVRGASERRAQGVTGPGSQSRHVITTLAVDVIDTRHATSESYFLFFRNTSDAPTVFNMGHYQDEYLCEGGKWRVKKRTIRFG